MFFINSQTQYIFIYALSVISNDQHPQVWGYLETINITKQNQINGEANERVQWWSCYNKYKKVTYQNQTWSINN